LEPAFKARKGKKMRGKTRAVKCREKKPRGNEANLRSRAERQFREKKFEGKKRGIVMGGGRKDSHKTKKEEERWGRNHKSVERRLRVLKLHVLRGGQSR